MFLLAINRFFRRLRGSSLDTPVARRRRARRTVRMQRRRPALNVRLLAPPAPVTQQDGRALIWVLALFFILMITMVMLPILAAGAVVSFVLGFIMKLPGVSSILGIVGKVVCSGFGRWAVDGGGQVITGGLSIGVGVIGGSVDAVSDGLHATGDLVDGTPIVGGMLGGGVDALGDLAGGVGGFLSGAKETVQVAREWNADLLCGSDGQDGLLQVANKVYTANEAYIRAGMDCANWPWALEGAVDREEDGKATYCFERDDEAEQASKVIPSWLIPIYISAGERYNVPWHLLAAINYNDSRFGQNVEAWTKRNTNFKDRIGFIPFNEQEWKESGVDGGGTSPRESQDVYGDADQTCKPPVDDAGKAILGGAGMGALGLSAGEQAKLKERFTDGQLKFSITLAKETGLPVRVVLSWVINEMSSTFAEGREADSNHNWLNIGYFDSGAQQGITGQAGFKDPISAGHLTAEFLKGRSLGASDHIKGIIKHASDDPEDLMSYIGFNGSGGWATSGYGGNGKLLKVIYKELPEMREPSGSTQVLPSGTTTVPDGETDACDPIDAIFSLARRAAQHNVRGNTWLEPLKGLDLAKQDGMPTTNVGESGGERKSESSGDVDKADPKERAKAIKTNSGAEMKTGNDSRSYWTGTYSIKTGLKPIKPCEQAKKRIVPTAKAAGRYFGVDWTIIMAVIETETSFGCTLKTSSAGAIGWTQFMPATFTAYGMDADGDGQADPYNSVDSVFSAARYLAASGAPKDYRKAIFAYNHANWYVKLVQDRSKKYKNGGDDVSDAEEAALADPAGTTEKVLMINAGALKKAVEKQPGVSNVSVTILDDNGAVRTQAGSGTTNASSAAKTLAVLSYARKKGENPLGSTEKDKIEKALTANDNAAAAWIADRLSDGRIKNTARAAEMDDFQLRRTDAAWPLGASKVSSADLAHLWENLADMLPDTDRRWLMKQFDAVPETGKFGVWDIAGTDRISGSGWRPEKGESDVTITQGAEISAGGRTYYVGLVMSGAQSVADGKAIAGQVLQQGLMMVATAETATDPKLPSLEKLIDPGQMDIKTKLPYVQSTGAALCAPNLAYPGTALEMAPAARLAAKATKVHGDILLAMMKLDSRFGCSLGDPQRDTYGWIRLHKDTVEDWGVNSLTNRQPHDIRMNATDSMFTAARQLAYLRDKFSKDDGLMTTLTRFRALQVGSGEERGKAEKNDFDPYNDVSKDIRTWVSNVLNHLSIDETSVAGVDEAAIKAFLDGRNHQIDKELCESQETYYECIKSLYREVYTNEEDISAGTVEGSCGTTTLPPAGTEGFTDKKKVTAKAKPGWWTVNGSAGRKDAVDATYAVFTLLIKCNPKIKGKMMSINDFGMPSTCGCHATHKNGSHVDIDIVNATDLPNQGAAGAGYDRDFSEKAATMFLRAGATRVIFNDTELIKRVHATRAKEAKEHPGVVKKMGWRFTPEPMFTADHHDNHYHVMWGGYSGGGGPHSNDPDGRVKAYLNVMGDDSDSSDGEPSDADDDGKGDIERGGGDTGSKDADPVK